MSDLKALNPEGLPANFNLAEHGEKPIITIAVQDRTLRLTYQFPGYSFADLSATAGAGADPAGQTDFLHEVGIRGTGFLSESGKPLLPSFGRFLQIPPGFTYKVRVEESGLRELENMKIRPAQENATDQAPWTFEFDDATYGKDHLYPEKIVEVSEPFYMDGYRTLCLHVRPMQYNPAKERLYCYSTIEVAVELSPEPAPQESGKATGEVPLWAYQDQKRSLEGFGNFLFNPERKFFIKAGLRAPTGEMVKRRADQPEFLILYGEALQTPARKLQVWKRKCGLDTDIVPVAQLLAPLGAGSSCADQVKAIKTFIRTMRGKPGSPLRYVLLLGDISTIPSEERPRPGTGAVQCDTTDLYYFTHRDAERDECLLPWVAGGRIAARDEGEGLAVVDQIIRYESTPPEDPDYFTRMTVAAYFEDKDRLGRQDGRANQAYMKTMESIRDHMVSHGFEVQRVYVSNNRRPAEFSDGTPVPLKLREELIYKTDGPLATKKLMGLINTGQLIIGHRGHGDQLGWLNPPLRTADIQSIAGTTPSIFFSISCRTGSFDGARECFAEELLAMNGGAPSLVAATELSGSWRNDSMIKALFDAIWPGVIPTYPVTTMRFPVKYYRMGDILNYAKAYLLIAHGVNANTQKHFEIYHVVGDPTLHVWGSEPGPLRLRTRLAEDILVVNMNSCPRDAVLSVWYEEDCLLKMEPTGTRLAIPLMLFDQLPDDARSTKRKKPYQLSVYLWAPGHRLAASHLWF